MASCSSEGDDTGASDATVAAAPDAAAPDAAAPEQPESDSPAGTEPSVDEPAATEPPPTEPAVSEPAEVPGLPAAYVDYESEVYSDDAVWLCRGGVAAEDIYERDLDATAVFADGTTEP